MSAAREGADRETAADREIAVVAAAAEIVAVLVEAAVGTASLRIDPYRGQCLRAQMAEEKTMVQSTRVTGRGTTGRSILAVAVAVEDVLQIQGIEARVGLGPDQEVARDIAAEIIPDLPPAGRRNHRQRQAQCYRCGYD